MRRHEKKRRRKGRKPEGKDEEERRRKAKTQQGKQRKQRAQKKKETNKKLTRLAGLEIFIIALLILDTLLRDFDRVGCRALWRIGTYKYA